MLIRAKSPLRISFAGGGTDVPPYPQKEGGCVLSATINKYAYGTLKPRDDDQIQVRSLDFEIFQSYDVENYDVDGKLIYDGKLDLVKAAINRFQEYSNPKGFELFLQSDAPPGSGLGSSSAMTSTLAGLLREFIGISTTDYGMADIIYKIEREDLGIKGGLQDQYATVFGGFNYIEFLAHEVIVHPLRLKPYILNELTYNLLLCYTGKTRPSDNIISDQVENYKKGKDKTIEGLRELKNMTIDMKNALLLGNLNNFGELLHYSWESKKKMSDRITNPIIDEMYEESRKNGVIGGKLLGAGGGGYMVLYCQFDKKYKVAKKLREMGGKLTEFDFENGGLQTWRSNADS